MRIFDIHTLKCYIALDHHTSGVTRVRYSPGAASFASSSHDGTVKIYDAVTSSCITASHLGKKLPITGVRTITAHGGLPVTSVEFNRSGTQMLTTGHDNIGRLWDVSSAKEIMTYKGAQQGVLLK